MCVKQCWFVSIGDDWHNKPVFSREKVSLFTRLLKIVKSLYTESEVQNIERQIDIDLQFYVETIFMHTYIFDGHLSFALFI